MIHCLTVRQPGAWLLIHGTKDIENRDWATSYRGELWIHASKGMTRSEYEDARAFVARFDPALAEAIPQPVDLVRGAIIRKMILRVIVTESGSPWFQGIAWPMGLRFSITRRVGWLRQSRLSRNFIRI